MGCAYTRPLKVFSNKAKEDVIPREAERSREAVRPRPPPMVCRQCRQAVGALRIAIPPRRKHKNLYKNLFLCSFILLVSQLHQGRYLTWLVIGQWVLRRWPNWCPARSLTTPTLALWNLVASQLHSRQHKCSFD